MVAGPEIADVRGLKIAHFGTAFLLREAGGWVLLSVFPAMVQQQQHGHEQEGRCCDQDMHASGCLRLYTVGQSRLYYVLHLQCNCDVYIYMVSVHTI